VEEGEFPNGYHRRRRVTVPAGAVRDEWASVPTFLGQRSVRFEMLDGTPLEARAWLGSMWVKVPLLAEDEATTVYMYYRRDEDVADDLRRHCVCQVETAFGVGPGFSGLLSGPGILSLAAPLTAEEVAKMEHEMMKGGEIHPLEPMPPPDLIVRATVGGERLRLRYAPQPGMTGQEAGWAAQLATFAANPDVDWGDWVATRGMLRHFEVVEG
jgi:hypothetical protein